MLTTSFFAAVLAAIVLIPSAHSPADRPQEVPAALRSGTPHRLLRSLAGEYEATVSMHSPDGKAVVTRGHLKRTACGEFHLIDSFEGEMMGMPFSGRGLNGYCNVRKKFFVHWVDTMTPSPMVLEGNYDEKAAELRLEGTCFGMSGGLERCRAVLRIVDAERSTWTFSGIGADGRETEHLRIEYTRKR